MDKMRSIAVKRDSIRQSFRADKAAADVPEAVQEHVQEQEQETNFAAGK
jgi:hypothetical protein